MRYKAQIQIYEDPQLVYDTFAAEQSSVVGKRMCLALQDKKDHVAFDISALDPVAMRAALNSVTKGLAVISKMKSLI